MSSRCSSGAASRPRRCVHGAGARRGRRRRSRRRAGDGGRGRGDAHPRPGDRSALHRGAAGGDRDPEAARSPRARRTPHGPGHEVARAREPARGDLHGDELDGPDRRAHEARRRWRGPGADALSAAEAGRVHRAPGHAALPAGAHHDAARPRDVGGRHPRQHRPRGTPGGAGSVPARPASTGAPGDRRRGRGHQPAARPSDGQLRPALEPEPPGAAVRPHPPDRADGGLSSVEPGRGRDPRGRRLPAAAGEAGAGAAGARRPGVRRARQAGVRRAAPAGAAAQRHPLRRTAGGAGEARYRPSTRPSTGKRSRTLLEERQLVHDAMDATRVQRVREEMERAEARRLQQVVQVGDEQFPDTKSASSSPASARRSAYRTCVSELAWGASRVLATMGGRWPAPWGSWTTGRALVTGSRGLVSARSSGSCCAGGASG